MAHARRQARYRDRLRTIKRVTDRGPPEVAHRESLVVVELLILGGNQELCHETDAKNSGDEKRDQASKTNDLLSTTTATRCSFCQEPTSGLLRRHYRRTPTRPKQRDLQPHPRDSHKPGRPP